MDLKNNVDPNELFQQIFSNGNMQPVTKIKRRVAERNHGREIIYEVTQKMEIGPDGNPAEVMEEVLGKLDDGSPYDLRRGYDVCGNGHIVSPGNIGRCEKCGRKYCTIHGCTMYEESKCRTCGGKVLFGNSNEYFKLPAKSDTQGY